WLQTWRFWLPRRQFGPTSHLRFEVPRWSRVAYFPSGDPLSALVPREHLPEGSLGLCRPRVQGGIERITVGRSAWLANCSGVAMVGRMEITGMSVLVRNPLL